MLSYFDECDKTSSPDSLYDLAVSLKSSPNVASLFASIVQSQTTNKELKHKAKLEFGKFEELSFISTSTMISPVTNVAPVLTLQDSLNSTTLKVDKSKQLPPNYVSFEIPTFTNFD